jgi:hypothetical protein
MCFIERDFFSSNVLRIGIIRKYTPSESILADSDYSYSKNYR